MYLYNLIPAKTPGNYPLRNVKEIPTLKVKHRFFIFFHKILNIYNSHSLKLLTRLRLGLSHLCGHKFNHNFSDCLDEICMCGKDIETRNYFLLQCSLFLNERQVLMNKIPDIDSSLIDQNENSLSYTFLFGKKNMNDSENTHILKQQ